MKNNIIYKAELFFVQALLPFIAGIVIAYLKGKPEWTNWCIHLTIFLFASLLFMNMFYRSFEVYKFRGLTGIFCFVFLFTAGLLCSLLHKQDFKKNHFAKSKYAFLKVRIDDEPLLKNGVMRFRAEVLKGYLTGNVMQSLQATGSLQVAVYFPGVLQLSSDRLSLFKYGNELIVQARYKAVDTSLNPGEFDYRSWLATKNIYHQTFLKQDQLTFLNTNSGNPLIRFALEWRARQISFYRKIIKNDDAFGLASTLILGYKSDLNADTLNIYSKTGTIHALSVSGMHVGIVYLVINWILQFLVKKRSLIPLKVIIILGLVWFYTLVTGFSPSALRSAIMLSAFVIAKFFTKQSNSYNILAFSAFCLLLYDPFYIWDAGFQLSFLAVLGLIYLQPKIRQWLYFKNKPIDKLWELTTISLAAQITTFPLSIYYFHQFPTYFIISNLFIVLPIAVLMYLGLLIILLKTEFLAPVFEWLIEFTNTGLKWIADFPFANLSGIWINKIELLCLSVALTLFCLALTDRNKKLLLVALYFFLIFQAHIGYDLIKASDQQKVVIFNLRKNHVRAYFSGSTALIITDLKPDSKDFKYHVQPALDLHKIRKIKIFERADQK